MNTDELPEGWELSKFLDVVNYEGGTQPPKKQFVYEPIEGYIRLLQIRDFGPKPFPTYIPDSTNLKKARHDDLLLARYGGGGSDDSLGRICTGLSGAYNVALVKLVIEKRFVLPGFVKIFLSGKWFRDCVGQNSRSCQVGFNRDDLQQLTLPLPPLAEQRRIVAAVERILGKVTAARARLDRVPTTLKRFRQAVLAAACSGRLTADWRDKQSGIEPADQILQSLADSRGISDPITQADDLPHNWAAVSLGYLTEWGTRGRPFITSGSRGWAKLVGSVGRYFIRSENINTDHLRLEEAVRVNVSEGSEADRTQVRPGDLLLTITGNNVGRTAVVPDGCPIAHVSQHVAIIRIVRAVEVDFVWLWLRSEQHGKSGLEHYGETKPGLNLEQIREHVVNLPPLAEQTEIVRRVSALFARADAIEATVTAARKRVDALTQAVLAKAFRGNWCRPRPHSHAATTAPTNPPPSCSPVCEARQQPSPSQPAPARRRPHRLLKSIFRQQTFCERPQACKIRNGLLSADPRQHEIGRSVSRAVLVTDTDRPKLTSTHHESAYCSPWERVVSCTHSV